MAGKSLSVNFLGRAPQRPPEVKTLDCPSCGGSLTVRGMGQTESIACGSCGSIIDITDKNLKIIDAYKAKIKHQPLIPLGTRGKLRGEPFEVIGFLRRRVNIEGLDYHWSEYLLFNPYTGFRWLSEYNGHWNYIRTITHRLVEIPGAQPKVEFLKETFLHFQSAAAEVTYVLGEFHWKVRVGERSLVSDYVASPRILSREETDKEVTWSLGEYMEPETVRASFQLKTPLRLKIGIAPNQPSPYKPHTSKILKFLGVFLLVALLIQVFTFAASQNKLVYKNRFTFRQSDREKSLVTEAFQISGRRSNVMIKTGAGVDNSWLYLNLALINEGTGNAYDFSREIGFYHGRDSDGPWSEGSNLDKAVLPSVPSGRYYLRIEPESSVPIVDYSIEIYRDVPHWTFFLVSVGLLLLPAAIHLYRRHAYEYHRWQESDHPMVNVEDEDED